MTEPTKYADAIDAAAQVLFAEEGPSIPWDSTTLTESDRQSWRDYVTSIIETAAPLIAARTLDDFADAHRMPWVVFLRDDGSPVKVGDLMREQAARLREAARDE